MTEYNSMYDVIIIGCGPAGLTAGLYTARAGLKTLLIESPSITSQTMLASTIENYPGFPEEIEGFELIERLKKQANKFGVELKMGEVKNIQQDFKDKKIFKIDIEDKRYISLSLIIATGARHKELGILGEDRLHGRGVSYCAVCDGFFFKDKNIIVVGGGNTALSDALFLTKFCKKITVVHRREKLRATKILQEKAFANKKINFIWDSVVKEIKGDEKVESVRILNLKIQKEMDLSCEGIFISVGLIPNTNFLGNIVNLDEQGYIITDENMKTSSCGIFACGDCRKKILRQIITACGDGAIAAYSAQIYVEEIKRKSNSNSFNFSSSGKPSSFNFLKE